MAEPETFVARIACPACAFPIGIRASDRKKARVRCPVCGAHASVTVEAPASDGPFREGVESLALVATKQPAAESGGALIKVTPPVFAVERAGRYDRILNGASLATLGAAVGFFVAGVAFMPFVGVMLALGMTKLVRHRQETGRVDGAELVNVHETPWSRTDRILLPGATVRTEPQANPAEHVVIVEQGESALVIGATVPLGADEADAIAARLRKAIDEMS